MLLSESQLIYMFTNIIYLILFLLLYSTNLPIKYSSVTYSELIQDIILIYIFFIFITYLSLKRIESKIDKDINVRRKYYNNQNFLVITALFLYSIIIYQLNYKYFLKKIYIFKISSFLTDLAGLILALIFFIILWSISTKVYNKLFNASYSVFTSISGKLKLLTPVLIPWFIINLIIDVLAFFKISMPFRSYYPYNELLFIMAFFILLSLILPVIVTNVWNCTRIRDYEIRTRVLDLCKKENLKIADILLWPLFGSKGISAGIMGPYSKFRYILITPALLGILSNEELDSVIYHEIGHAKKYHILFYLLFLTGYIVFSYYFYNLSITGLILIQLVTGYTINSPFIISTALLLPTLFFFLFYIRFCFGILSRNFERQADIFALEKTGSPDNIINSLDKISYYSGNIKEVSNWHHYSVGERIRFLESCSSNPVLILKHHEKVKKIKFLLAFFLIAGIIGLRWFSSDNLLKKIPGSLLLEKYLVNKIDKNPGDIESRFALAEIYSKKNNIKKSVTIYQEIIKIAPENADALNNLAWIILTSSDSDVLDYKKGLTLAKKAFSLKQKSYIMDTLAEAYFKNGNPEKAVALEKKALDKLEKTDDKNYYMKQIKKFENEFQEPKQFPSRFKQ